VLRSSTPAGNRLRLGDVMIYANINKSPMPHARPRFAPIIGPDARRTCGALRPREAGRDLPREAPFIVRPVAPEHLMPGSPV
ncbi:MAG: hypothetical protein VB138_15195, partial [Burkholderia sp.]